MKLFMINLDDNEEDIDVSQPVEIEIEQNKQIGDLNDLLYIKYDISDESVLHFAIQSNLKPLVLDRTVECSSVYTNYVSVYELQNDFSTIIIYIESLSNRFLCLLNVILSAKQLLCRR